MPAPIDIPQLVRDAQKGDSEAFTVLVQRFQKEIYTYTAKHVRDHEDAHDLTQQVFLKAWLNINYLGPLRFTQKREEEDDHTESPAKPTTEEDLVCARSTNSHECG